MFHTEMKDVASVLIGLLVMGEIDVKMVKIQCDKSSEMNERSALWRGDVKKGGICSGSCG